MLPSVGALAYARWSPYPNASEMIGGVWLLGGDLEDLDVLLEL